MKLLKPGYITVCLIAVVIIAVTFAGCAINQKENLLEPTNNLEEVPLPVNENTVVTDMKTSSNGELLISTMEKEERDSPATAMIWKMNKDDKWDKIFEKEFVEENPDKASKEAIINIIGDTGVIGEYDHSKNGDMSTTCNIYIIDDMRNNEIKMIFESPTEFLDTLWGDNLEKVHGVDLSTWRVVKMNFETGEKDTLEEFNNVTEMCSHKNLAYVIYKQDYDLTEEEMASLTPNSDFPERYARGVIYDMDSGSITESKVLDKLAVRFFEKWHKGGENVYNYQPIYYPAIGSDKEAYYLAHNDGVYRIDEEGEELICCDKSWKSKKNCLNLMTVAEKGDIYLCVYLNNYEEVKLYRIKP